jgi:hypothetical protein
MRKLLAAIFCLLIASHIIAAQSASQRVLSGVVVTARDELVPGVTVIVVSPGGELTTVSDAEGSFRLIVPDGALSLKLSGENIAPLTKRIAPGEASENLRLIIEYVVPPIHESMVIVDSSLEPGVERRNEEIYRGTLFSRDDQLFDTLAAGINAGQHEGGGKSLEVRRFGFNLDHGGLFGGLKVLVDDVQQNFATQGHGQGYLGQLKSLTPELVKEVDILNGPFSAPHTVANAGFTLSDYRGFSGSLRYRHTSNYRLDPLDAGIRASGLDVVDLGVNKRLARSLDFNLAVDNLFNKRYFETQNFFESRVRPGGDAPAERIHATPGYPFGVTIGLTFRFHGK